MWMLLSAALGAAPVVAEAPAAPPGPVALSAAGLAPELAPMAGLVGRWVGRGDEEFWVPAGDALFGVALTRGEAPTTFELCTIEAKDGAIRYVAAHNGIGPVPFVWDPGSAWTWDNPEHDFPQRVRYERRGSRMDAWVGTLSDPDAVRFRWKAAPPEPAPALEAADRAFAVDVAARGVDAWLGWFHPEGYQVDDAGQKVPVGPEMRARMAPMLDGGAKLAWEPRHSGLSAAGDLGFTIGDWTWTDAAGTVAARGAYVTLWAKAADGSWKVWFDTGDSIGGPDPRPATSAALPRPP